MSDKDGKQGKMDWCKLFYDEIFLLSQETLNEEVSKNACNKNMLSESAFDCMFSIEKQGN